MKTIHPLNRAQLIDDSMNLARASYLDYEIAFQILESIKYETEYPALIAAVNNLKDIGNLFRPNPTQFKIYQNYVIGLLKPLYNKLGFHTRPGDNHVKKILRTLIVETMCLELHYEPCVTSAINNFDIDSNKIDVDERFVTSAVIIRELINENKRS